VDLLLLAPLSEADFEQAEEAIRDSLIAVEQMGNRFNPDSELSQAVQKATHQTVHLSPALFSLLTRCLKAHQETDGLFDITVSSPNYAPGLINYVELIPACSQSLSSDSGSEHTAPSATASAERGLDERGGFLRLHKPDIILDLSGILKGYAIECLRELLPPLNIHDALINLGNSSILSLGNNPSDIPAGHCLTTSGNAYSERRHIINPLTGQFVTGLHQVSVTTIDAIEGEILSTTQFIQQSLKKSKEPSI